MEIVEYAPEDIQLKLDNWIVQSLTSVSVRRNKEKFKTIYGLRGVNTRVKTLDTSCEIVFTVLQGSISNDILNQIINKDGEKGQDNLIALGNIKVSLKDMGGTTFVECDGYAYIDTIPELSYSAEQSDRAWKICCLKTDTLQIGGNFTKTQALAAK